MISRNDLEKWKKFERIRVRYEIVFVAWKVRAYFRHQNFVQDHSHAQGRIQHVVILFALWDYNAVLIVERHNRSMRWCIIFRIPCGDHSTVSLWIPSDWLHLDKYLSDDFWTFSDRAEVGPLLFIPTYLLQFRYFRALLLLHLLLLLLLLSLLFFCFLFLLILLLLLLLLRFSPLA